MVKVQRILFPTDFSDCAEQARHYACDLAQRYDAHLHTIHVIHHATLEVPEFGMGLAFPGYVENLPKQRHELELAALDTLKKQFIGEEVTPAKGVEYHVEFGQPFASILKYADEHAIDMIVVGTHGRTGLSHVLLGSVAERIIQKAKCPVVTVHRHDN